MRTPRAGSLLHQVGGTVESRMTGGDPYMVSGPLSVPGKPGDVVVLVIAGKGTNGEGSLYWGNETGAPAPERTISFTYPADGTFHTVRVPVGSHPQWVGYTITELRLDPATAEPLGDIALDSISLERAK
jgi:hypothetical protein